MEAFQKNEGPAPAGTHGLTGERPSCRSVASCAMSRMIAAMSFEEMRDSLGCAPAVDDDHDDGEVEITRVWDDVVDGTWDGARYARGARLSPHVSRASSSRDSSTFGDGNDYEELLRLDEDNIKRGLSAAAIQKLRRRSVTSREKLEDPITKEVIKPGTNVFHLPCGHCFEKPTVLKWFEKHRTCPVCRHEIEA